MSRRSLPPRLHPPGTTQAGCPFRPPGCRCLTSASCSHARLLLHQMGNGDADLGVPATPPTVAHLGKTFLFFGFFFLIPCDIQPALQSLKINNSTMQLLPGLGGHHRSPSRRAPARRQPPSSSSPFWSSRVERQFSLSARVKSCFLGKTVPPSS